MIDHAERLQEHSVFVCSGEPRACSPTQIHGRAGTSPSVDVFAHAAAK